MKALITLLLLLFAVPAHAVVTYTSTASGNWSNPATWSRSSGTADYPGTAADDIAVISTVPVTLDVSPTLGSITTSNTTSAGALISCTTTQTVTASTSISTSGAANSWLFNVATGGIALTITTPVLTVAGSGYGILVTNGLSPKSDVTLNGKLYLTTGGYGIATNNGCGNLTLNNVGGVALEINQQRSATMYGLYLSNCTASVNGNMALTQSYSGSSNAYLVYNTGTCVCTMSGDITHYANATTFVGGIAFYSAYTTTNILHGNITYTGSSSCVTFNSINSGANKGKSIFDGNVTFNSYHLGNVANGASCTWTGTHSVTGWSTQRTFGDTVTTYGETHLEGLVLTVNPGSGCTMESSGVLYTDASTRIIMADPTAQVYAPALTAVTSYAEDTVSNDYILTGQGSGTLTLPPANKVKAGTVYGSGIYGNSNTGSLYIGAKP